MPIDWWPPTRMPSEASTRADLLGHAAVGGRREAVAAVLLGDRHAERAELARGPSRPPAGRGARARSSAGVDVVLREAAEGRRGTPTRSPVPRRAISGKGKTSVFRDLPREERLDDGNDAGLGDGRDGARKSVCSWRDLPGCAGRTYRSRSPAACWRAGGWSRRARSAGPAARRGRRGARRRGGPRASRRSAAGRRGTAGSRCRRSSRGRACAGSGTISSSRQNAASLIIGQDEPRLDDLGGQGRRARGARAPQGRVGLRARARRACLPRRSRSPCPFFRPSRPAATSASSPAESSSARGRPPADVSPALAATSRPDVVEERERARPAFRTPSSPRRRPRCGSPRGRGARPRERYGARIRLTRKPGASLTTTGVFPSVFASAKIVATVSVARALPADDLDERHPVDRVEEVHPDDALAARAPPAAISVIGSVEVFDAKIAVGGTAASHSFRTARLTASFSTTASIVTSQRRKPE